MWLFGRKGPSGFSASSTAEEVTEGIDGTGLTAIVTGNSFGLSLYWIKIANWVVIIFKFQCFFFGVQVNFHSFFIWVLIFSKNFKQNI